MVCWEGCGHYPCMATVSDNKQVLALLHKYHVTYVFVGQMEQQEYGNVADLGRFIQFLTPGFRNSGITIYRVPWKIGS